MNNIQVSTDSALSTSITLVEKFNPTEIFSNEIVLKIFQYLNKQELGRCCSVSKTWNTIAKDKKLWLNLIAFGPEKWSTYFGDVGQAPPLPKDIYEILKSPCPFWEGKRVEETHMLVLIPATINGENVTLNTLEELIQNPKQGNKTKFYLNDNLIKDEHGDKLIEQSYWILMTRDIIRGSRGESYPKQQKRVSLYEHYLIPQIREAAICVLMEYVTSGKYLYDFEHLTYTRCEEKVMNQYPIFVGGFGSGGLRVGGDLFFDLGGYGVGAVRKL